MRVFNDITGQRFGRIEVLERAPHSGYNAYFLCKCDCGTTKIIMGKSLRSGKSKSCGCLAKEMRASEKTTHGMHKSRLYSIWRSMISRCKGQNPCGEKYYASRGISVCGEWGKFEPFKEWAMAHGYREDMTIDRIDNDLGYFPDNCRWATVSQQNRNLRTNHLMMFQGKMRPLIEVSEITGLGFNTIRWRLSHGWSDEMAVSDKKFRGKLYKNILKEAKDTASCGVE